MQVIAARVECLSGKGCVTASERVRLHLADGAVTVKIPVQRKRLMRRVCRMAALQDSAFFDDSRLGSPSHP